MNIRDKAKITFRNGRYCASISVGNAYDIRDVIRSGDAAARWCSAYNEWGYAPRKGIDANLVWSFIKSRRCVNVQQIYQD